MNSPTIETLRRTKRLGTAAAALLLVGTLAHVAPMLSLPIFGQAFAPQAARARLGGDRWR